jgi:hypothetical protein
MTKGDRDKLRAELAGKAMAAILSNSDVHPSAQGCGDDDSWASRVAFDAAMFADALMAELGLKVEE